MLKTFKNIVCHSGQNILLHLRIYNAVKRKPFTVFFSVFFFKCTLIMKYCGITNPINSSTGFKYRPTIGRSSYKSWVPIGRHQHVIFSNQLHDIDRNKHGNKKKLFILKILNLFIHKLNIISTWLSYKFVPCCSMAQNFLIGDAQLAKKKASRKRAHIGHRVGASGSAADISKYTRINVSGRVFLIHEEHLRNYPKTLLGSRDREKYWREDLDAYYFDRNREFFVSVQQFYQREGEFCLPHAIDDRNVIKEELNFYRISVKLRPKDGFELEEIVTLKPSKNEILYMLLNFPKSSTSANVLAWLDCILIGLSVVMLVIESEPMYKKYFSDRDEHAHTLSFAANCIIMGYFTIDYVLRLSSHPSTIGFFKLHLPWLDLLSILPFYVELVMMMMPSGDEAGEHSHDDKAYTILRVCYH